MKNEKLFNQLKEIIPSNIKKISFDYYGDGDDFDEFISIIYLDKNDNWITGVLSSEIEDNLKELITDYVFKLFNTAKNPSIFNDDGSSGNIIFDLTNGAVELQNNYLDYESEEPIVCDPEFFNMIK